MKQFKDKLSNFFLILTAAVILFGSGYKLGQKQSISNFFSPTTNHQSPVTNFDLFFDAWSKLETKYVDKSKIDRQKMYYGAIKGMVASVDDPYTFFLTPEENKQSKDDLQGKFEGIGAQLGLKDKRVIVIAPLKQSPAEKAGVRAGDFINKVDDKNTNGWTLSQAVSKIRGPKGTKVKLTLERQGKEIEVTIIRDQIVVSSVELSFEKNIALLKLNQFGETTNDEWDKAVEQIKSQWSTKKIKGMILDLRDNPGGYLESSVYLASEFLKKSDLVVKQESTVNPSHEYLSERDGLLQGIPLVVLINKGSASASEILAGALRDHKKATLVGEKSFGKGSVQEALNLSQGAGLHIILPLPNGFCQTATGLTVKALNRK